jgi:thiol:disulfide interchange protein DsbC
MTKVFAPLVLLCLLFSLNIQAKSSATDEASFKNQIETKLKAINPAFQVESITESEMPDVFEVQINEGPLLYVHSSSNYMIAGNLFKLTDKGIENLTDKREAEKRKAFMGDVKKADAIVFMPKPPQKVKANIYVYTDVDCGYCRKLHQEVPKLTEAGIAVHYLAFPRAGIGSPSYKKIATAWCVKNRNETMNKLKNGEFVKVVSCDNPVEAQYELGKKMGVNGTPAILLEDGTLIPGYRPAEDLIPMILK